ncbi:MAG: TIM barrel protein [Rhodobacteraceae bacterium]|nr:TIM barrel protein [Paracoccaceae bacterium]
MTVFALNHMAAPRLDAVAFLDLAQRLGCIGVEFRNDLGRPLFDGRPPEAIRDAAAARGLRILALAEVKMFNDWSPAKADEALALMKIAVACGAEAVSLIPRNDNRGMEEGFRRAVLRRALADLKPMLEDHGLVGMVEPLGFEICALRHKAEAVEAIEAVGGTGRFRLVHDTFHHHLAGGGPIFAAHTGIVHVSGVTDPTLAVADMRDGHRVLVDADDRLGNLAQIAALRAAGYRGPVSFEPFAESVHALADPAAALEASMEFIRAGLAAEAA